MKVGLKYKEIYPDGTTASNRVVCAVTGKSVFSQNIDSPQPRPARESIIRFIRAIKKGFYILEI